VIAEAGRDVSPFRKERLVGSAASDVAADGHGAEGAAVITLAARDYAEFLQCAGFEMKLAREFDGGFGGFGATGSEIDAAVCEIWRGERKKSRGEFFGGSGVELSGVGERDLRSLGNHGVGDGLDAVTDVDNGGLAGSVEIFIAVGGDDPGTFAADGGGKRFLEIAGKESGHEEKL